MNIVRETGADEFSSTNLSNALIIPRYRDGNSYWFVTDILILPYVMLIY